MKRRFPVSNILAFSLFLAACVVGVWAQSRNVPRVEIPRARYNDGTPLGGKGLRLMLERMGYTTKLEDGILKEMPEDAKVWVLLDPQAGFSANEAKLLLQWVDDGGTMVWSGSSMQSPSSTPAFNSGEVVNAGIASLGNELKISRENYGYTKPPTSDSPLPPLEPLNQGAASVYWTGVKKAKGSPSGFTVKQPFLEIAGTPVDTQLARIDYGKGRVFVAPDALLFTNYALSKPDNAVLVTNMIRAHVPSGMVYFDERSHGDDLEKPVVPNLLYYLWRPPLRYALLQLLITALLLWALFGRRLGSPVPIPDAGPVTRASQFAAAMGSLFQKVQRPRVAGHIIGEDFRRQLTRRLGLSISDPDELIAQRAAEVTGYSSRLIDRLLLQAKTPDNDEIRTLKDVQEMEMILRSLDKR